MPPPTYPTTSIHQRATHMTLAPAPPLAACTPAACEPPNACRPEDSAVVREVKNNCRVAPAELPGVVTVSASGVRELAFYSTMGVSVVDVTAPGALPVRCAVPCPTVPRLCRTSLCGCTCK